MNKEELIITNEDIELLKEMKNNCLKTDVYNDEKRLLKANAITKFLMLQQENNKLKEQYCERTDCGGRIGNSRKVEKLIQENKELHNKIDKAIEYIENADWYLPQWEIRDKQPDKNSLLEILKDNE